MVRHPFDPSGIAFSRQSLVLVIEVAIVIVVPDRKTRHDIARKLLRCGLPLLSRVMREECLEQRPPHQRNSLLIEVPCGGD